MLEPIPTWEDTKMTSRDAFRAAYYFLRRYRRGTGLEITGGPSDQLITYHLPDGGVVDFWWMPDKQSCFVFSLIHTEQVDPLIVELYEFYSLLQGSPTWTVPEFE